MDLHKSPPIWAGSQWRTLIEEGYLLPEDIVIIGQRGVRQSKHEIEFARENNILIIPVQDIDEQGLPSICAQIDGQLKSADSIYVSLDIDSVDPSYCPAQKYPDAAGLTPREVLTIIRRSTANIPICGFDLACFSPRYDENQRGALLAARFTLEAIYVLMRERLKQ